MILATLLLAVKTVFVSIEGECPQKRACVVEFYDAGTAKPIYVYHDKSGTPGMNPVLSDQHGRWKVWIPSGVSVRFIERVL